MSRGRLQDGGLKLSTISHRGDDDRDDDVQGLAPLGGASLTVPANASDTKATWWYVRHPQENGASNGMSDAAGSLTRRKST